MRRGACGGRPAAPGTAVPRRAARRHPPPRRSSVGPLLRPGGGVVPRGRGLQPPRAERGELPRGFATRCFRVTLPSGAGRLGGGSEFAALKLRRCEAVFNFLGAEGFLGLFYYRFGSRCLLRAPPGSQRCGFYRGAASGAIGGNRSVLLPARSSESRCAGRPPPSQRLRECHIFQMSKEPGRCGKRVLLQPA